MAVQQQKVSKMKSRRRKAANRYKGLQVNNCISCGAPVLPHRACKSCGNYRGQQVISIED